jgi:hypothetical protein
MTVGSGGTGYGTDSINQHGYGTARSKVDAKHNKQGQQRDKMAAQWEELLTRALNTLTELLPSPYDDPVQVYDILPHPSIGPLLSLSQLPELLGSLLRNDSVSDWISRSDIYYAMIALLRRLADCELTVQTLIGRGWEKDKSCGIEEWMWGDGEIDWVKENDRIERTLPLYDHFNKLTRQCQAFMAGASGMMEAGDENEDDAEMVVKATSLCGDIIAMSGDMERAMAILKTTGSSNTVANGEGTSDQGKGKARDPSVDMEKEYSLACERLAFKFTTILGDDSNYKYVTELKRTELSTRVPRDRLHLVKELAVMATCLPPGVWVRVDEVRNDAM